MGGSEVVSRLLTTSEPLVAAAGSCRRVTAATVKLGEAVRAALDEFYRKSLGRTTLALAFHAPGEKYSDSVASLSTNKSFSSSSSLLGVHASAMAVCNSTP